MFPMVLMLYQHIIKQVHGMIDLLENLMLNIFVAFESTNSELHFLKITVYFG